MASPKVAVLGVLMWVVGRRFAGWLLAFRCLQGLTCLVDGVVVIQRRHAFFVLTQDQFAVYVFGKSHEEGGFVKRIGFPEFWIVPGAGRAVVAGPTAVVVADDDEHAV